jgi:inhibitor of KinA
MEGNPKTYFVFNESSILISYNCPTNSKLISNISNTKKRIVTHMNDCIVDIVQSINSILVIFDRTKISADDLIKKLKRIEETEDDLSKYNKIWQIPVCYNFKYAVDLENLAKEKKLSPSEIINIHKSKVYDVLSMGFLPGFMYMGFTNEKLHCERKEIPSLNIKKGSIGIALNQTCIYSQDSPGGWHIIGISPLDFFDLKSKNPCFAKPGDKIQFIEISSKKYQQMKKDNSVKPIYK